MGSSDNIDTKYFRSGVVVDSNILLLLFIGTYETSLVGRFKRLEGFTPDDYELLIAVLSRFQNLVVTPMILTEVSNLSNALPSDRKPAFYAVFSTLVEKMVEESRTSKEIVATELFKRFGYTDAAIAMVAEQRFLVLTDDFALAGFLSDKGIDVLNFNHLRMWAGLA